MGNYPAPASNKIQYDKDGSVVGKNSAGSGSYSGGIVTWLTGSQITALNDDVKTGVIGLNCLWILFPKARTITHFHLAMIPDYWGGSFGSLQGSDNTTNGVDGTWETATLGGTYYEQSNASTNLTAWRTKIGTVSFTKPMKAIRLYCPGGNSNTDDMLIAMLHLYGNDSVDDELVVTNSGGTKITSLVDFGDTPRGGTFNSTVYVKNASASPASAVTVDVEGTVFTTSLDNVTFDTTQKSIGALDAGAISAPIYVRFSPVAGTALGPSSGRILVNGTLG